MSLPYGKTRWFEASDFWAIRDDFGLLGKIWKSTCGFYYDCCANEGHRKQTGTGYMPTLEQAKAVVESIVGAK